MFEGAYAAMYWYAVAVAALMLPGVTPAERSVSAVLSSSANA